MTKRAGARVPELFQRVWNGVAQEGDFGLYRETMERLHPDNFGEDIANLPWPVYRPVARRLPAARGKGK